MCVCAEHVGTDVFDKFTVSRVVSGVCVPGLSKWREIVPEEACGGDERAETPRRMPPQRGLGLQTFCSSVDAKSHCVPGSPAQMEGLVKRGLLLQAEGRGCPP